MALSSGRKVIVGQTPYAHEREALEFAFGILPDTDPFQVWANAELLDPSTGRLYELDLLVLGYSALYLVEIKSGPGRYEGDHQEWWRTAPGEARPRYMDGPLSLCNLKAKVLKSRLQSRMKQPGRCPFVEPIIFLSATDLDLRLKPEGRIGVVTRADLDQALRFHKFPGANPNHRGERIEKPVMHDVAQALASLGLRPKKSRELVGSYELGSLLADGAGYQDRVAKHLERSFSTRARVYLVPQQASADRRAQLRRAADRESTLLWDVREHPHVLRIADYSTAGELGPTVVFDEFAGGVPLDAFLRHNPELPFADRLTVVDQVGRALEYCHRKSVVHGAIAPQSVLVRRHPDTQTIDTRIFNFQLGSGATTDGTLHWSQLAQESWAVYQAPELRENPTARSAQSDIFSLGALAYFTFTGRAPGDRVEDVERSLEKARYLDPRTVDDAIPQRLAEIFAFATDVAPVHRADNVAEWLELLHDAATFAEEVVPEEELDPLEAGKGAKLGGELEVKGLLGTGATARVLRVEDEHGREYALKVCSDPSHHDRIDDEAATLQALPRHPRIVELYRTLTLKDRKCLLLGIAGRETLQQRIAKLGPASLDEANRYGDDLLLALEHLEEHQVLHRDIKPANLGVGSVNKGKDHLLLFDFSLARVPLAETRVGTAVYRDPYLRTEGRTGWDYHADRWSAAITLHEMLAGTRPTFSGGSALEPEAKIAIAAERFDPSVRDELQRFFERCFARDVSARFGSAEDMRHAWVSILGAPARSQKSTKSVETSAAEEATEETAQERVSDETLAGILADAPIATLPLSVRARNALDRAGLTKMVDMLALGTNRLSAVRGVGRQVAKEILEFRDRWQALRTVSAAEVAPFFPGYAGEDFHVSMVSLGRELAAGLLEGGLPTLRAVAQAPTPQLEHLAKVHGFDLSAVRKTLAAENEKANQRAKPTTLEGWMDALLPPRKGRKDLHLVRALYGLEAPFAGRLDLTVRELADREQKTPAGIYIALGKARSDWATHSALPELREGVLSLLEELGGAAPLANIGEALAQTIPHSMASGEAVRTSAAALVRVVAELEKENLSGLRIVRLHDREPWVFLSDEHARVVRALGARADELALRPTLVSTGEVRRAFAEQVQGTVLVTTKEERLFALAAAASTRAASSARLEIFPRGLEPKRSLELCAATFKGGVTEDDVRARVALRYPEAAPLPPRPELDHLLAGLGFTWVSGTERGGQFTREDEVEPTFLATQNTTTEPRTRTALPHQPLAMDPQAIGARELDERLKHAVEMNGFRVLGVTAEKARDVALALEQALGAELVALDVELAREIDVQMRRSNIKSDDVVHSADREGPKGPHWPKLLKLVQAAANELVARLVQSKKPLLLVQPGPLARYGLNEALAKLVQAGQNMESPAMFLLVPMHDSHGVPRIEGTMTIPGALPGQSMWITSAWLKNRHNAAA
jgi:serine/threonine protein kinase